MAQRLTANEIGTLWTQNSQASMSVQILRYFIETVEDEEIKRVIEQALNVSIQAQEQTNQLMQAYSIPVPVGFTDQDVDITAPKLFSDSLMLQFIENMGKAGLLSYSVSLASCSNKEVRTLFNELLNETSQFFNISLDTALSNGSFLSPPQIEINQDIEFVQSIKYFSPFHKRTVNTIETTHLFENIKSNTVGELLCTGFAQTTKCNKVKKFMTEGRDISKKHIQTFTKIFNESDIHPPMSASYYVTQSTTPVFSDKMLVYFISVLTNTGQGNYSIASSASLRYDLVLLYQKLSVEIGLYAKKGLDLMIYKNWLEEPPQLVDRDKLIDCSKG
ncbi:DUF3231 family protein [Halobacillus sp. A5]|uniref:DUF3231 family protein n=1 Tax=Halobacillus sp. A5 TaxID=2880263 RepID=UPI0020A6D862|nr:DUF3231 family protein [Halobacillus sp. A5]